ncbi:hypothetical protein TELCIR_11332 [Teladorsagia circumcincta]|uniref:Uncharacterized protein n=1 Tax=Teladorsagia circumcincta TaxID=45464 RepID=A0A2G9U9N1_TELCI|nr:hypothetical protein TELCIR_11332 [Teladorsagia circumcincta]
MIHLSMKLDEQRDLHQYPRMLARCLICDRDVIAPCGDDLSIRSRRSKERRSVTSGISGDRTRGERLRTGFLFVDDAFEDVSDDEGSHGLRLRGGVDSSGIWRGFHMANGSVLFFLRRSIAVRDFEAVERNFLPLVAGNVGGGSGGGGAGGGGGGVADEFCAVVGCDDCEPEGGRDCVGGAVVGVGVEVGGIARECCEADFIARTSLPSGAFESGDEDCTAIPGAPACTLQDGFERIDTFILFDEAIQGDHSLPFYDRRRYAFKRSEYAKRTPDR